MRALSDPPSMLVGAVTISLDEIDPQAREFRARYLAKNGKRSTADTFFPGRSSNRAKFLKLVRKIDADADDLNVDQAVQDLANEVQRQLNAEAARGGDGGLAHRAEVLGHKKALADAITRDDHFAQDAGNRLYVYREGGYRPDGEEHVKRRVQGLLEAEGQSKAWSRSLQAEVAEFIRIKAPSLRPPPPNAVNLNNGILVVRDPENPRLRPHDPRYLASVQLPVAFDPSAACPKWEGFVSQVFPEDAQDLAWQIVAWLMLPETSLHKAVLLLGPGRNGKGSFLRGLRAFLGPENVSAIPLHQLGERFASSYLVGKLANLCADLPSTHQRDTSMFKMIVAGDPIPAEYKHGAHFTFEPFARLIFSANQAPWSPDGTDAYWHRWVVAEFTRSFEQGQPGWIPSKDLDAMLADPKELSGVLNKALTYVPDLYRHGFIEPESMRRAKERFREATDPIATWLVRHTAPDPGSYVPRWRLLQAYNAYANANGMPQQTEVRFGRELSRLRPTWKEGQRVFDGKPGTWVWLGIRLV